MSRFMRMMVFFDLPVQTPKERGAAARFRNFLLKDGYYMLQYSVYVRVCNGMDNVDLHRNRLRSAIPNNGSVRLMVVTEKQYESMDLLLGKLSVQEETQQIETITVF